MNTKLRRRLLRAAMLAGTCASCLGVAPATAASIRFDLPAEPLSVALRDYGRVSGRQIIFTEDLVRGLRAAGLSGRFEPGEALDKLLAGTGLTWRAAPSGGLMIVRDDALRPQSAAEEGPGPETLEAVVVVGSRLGRPKDGPAPVTVFDRAAIDRLGVANVADVLNYLPQQSFAFSEGVNVAGERRAQLRGLANGTTLVLINGRRTVPSAASNSRSVFDLNTIPLSAVDRVEVLSDSASAVYGADAVGGVVNIVLKTRLDGAVLDLSRGAAEGGADESRVSLSVGGAGAHARGVVVIDYFNRGALLGSERDLTANADYRRFGSVDRRTLTANPGNICAVSGNLPGLSTPCAAVPVGSSGIGLTPASFSGTAGLQNYDSIRRYFSIVPPSRRYSAMASGSLDLPGSVTAFGELMYADRQDTSLYIPRAVNNGLVPATNPFNPFGVAVRANFLLTGLPRSAQVSQETAYRETFGLTGAWRDWSWELAFVGAQSDATYQTNGVTDAARLSAALSATNPAQALNVFQDGPGGSFGLLSSLVTDPASNASRKASNALQVGGFARGQLFRLPAGPLQAVFGAEWRKETIAFVSPTINLTAGGAKRDSASAYAEFRAPVLAGGPGLGSVDLTLAGRYDDYSDFGGAFNAQYGLEWRPIPTFLARASYGESFRAPGLYQLYQPRSPIAGGVTTTPDPRRGGELLNADAITGGNPHLDPETSTASIFGVVWTPDRSWRPRLSASLWRISQAQRILGSFSVPTLLANEAYLPGRVVRAAPTAADIAAGRPGRVTSLDLSLLNQGRLDTTGLDLEATAVFDTRWGRFSPTLTATKTFRYDAADFVTSPIVHRVGIANLDGSIVAWKAVGSLTWSQGPLTVTGVARYRSAYDDSTSGTSPNGLKVGAQTLFDLQGSIDLGAARRNDADVTSGLTFRAGVTNLFDTAPAFSDIYGIGYDPSQGDIRQRFIYVALSKHF